MVQKKGKPIDPIFGKVMSEGKILGQDLGTVDLSKPFKEKKPEPAPMDYRDMGTRKSEQDEKFMLSPNFSRDMAVYNAIDKLDLQALKDALAKGGNPNMEYRGDTALTIAAASNRLDLVSALIDAGANVNLIDGEGNYPLTLAAANAERYDVLQKLLENSAQVNIQNKNGETAILVAAKNYNADGVQLMIHALADVNLADNYGMTPLMYAACNGMGGTINALLNTGANVNVVDNADGLTAFSCAVSNKEWKCAKMLRRHTKINYEDLKKLPVRHVWAYFKYTPIFG